MVERSPTVFDVLKERKLSGTNNEDPYKVGLAVEGGGMADAFPAGVGVALEAYDLIDCFDAVYGISAGSAIGSYMIAKQATEGIKMFYEDLPGPEFINFLRFTYGMARMRPLPLVDVEYLTHNVMMKKKPLMWQRVIEFPIQLHIYATSAKEPEVIDLHNFDGMESLHASIHYSCRLPVVAGMPVKDGNRYWTDGGVTIGALPLYQAMEDGCTHILTLLTHSERARREGKTSFVERAIVKSLARDFPELAAKYWEGDKNLLKSLSTIQTTQVHQQNGTPVHVQIESIAPPEDMSRLSILGKNPVKLFEAAQNGYYHGMNALTQTGLEFNNDIRVAA